MRRIFVLCLLACSQILRGIFWVLTITTGDQWRAQVFYLLYWLPNPLQFASFLLLPLFYTQVSTHTVKAMYLSCNHLIQCLISPCTIYEDEDDPCHAQCGGRSVGRERKQGWYAMRCADTASDQVDHGAMYVALT